MARVRGTRSLSGALAALLIAIGLVAGCSGVTNAEESGAAPSPGVSVPPTLPAPPASPGPSSPGEPAYCGPLRQLDADIRALGSASVIAGGVAAVQEGVDKIQNDVNAFQAAAKADFGPQVVSLHTSLTKLKTALQSAQSDPSVTTVSAVVTAAAEAVASYGVLRDAIANRCG